MFCFVDQILAVDHRRARGRFVVPEGLAVLPPWLVVEAIGQLAAWVAMARGGFRNRPVAALVGEVAILEALRAGARLDLAAEIERADDRAVLYAGRAHADGLLLVEINRCVGPLIAMDEFDDPATVRRRFELLCTASEPVRRLSADAVPRPLPLVPIEHTPGEFLRVRLRVPESAPFFANHFPRKPVFPATLLIDALCRVAVDLTAETIQPPANFSLEARYVRDIKIRAFTAPGQVIDIAAQLRSAQPGGADVAVSAVGDGQRVATALVEVRRRPLP